jgi:hypothetical protein
MGRAPTGESGLDREPGAALASVLAWERGRALETDPGSGSDRGSEPAWEELEPGYLRRTQAS